ncbi:MAG: hypothetical protein GXO04_02145 [Aquificae bacterium]|nr:hypothetical protein [Aquificota bacterium]
MRIEGGRIPFENEETLNKTQKITDTYTQKKENDPSGETKYTDVYMKVEIDEELRIVVVKIIDSRTGELVRQVPPEFIVELLRRIEGILGVFLDKRV